MKKLILAFALIFGIFAPSVQAQTKDDDMHPIIEIQFGRGSQGCTGFGICKFAIHLTAHDIATIVPIFFPGGLVLKMSPDFYRANIKAFPNNVFVIDEDYTVDQASMKLIGGKSAYTIKQGKYAVKFDQSTNTYNCTL
jgi:hypothetical protein